MRTPEVEAAMKRSVTDTELVETKTPPWNRETLASVDRRTLAAEIERLEAELAKSDEAARAAMYAVDERAFLAECAETSVKRAEAAEARVAELEAQNARLRGALEGLQSDAQCTLDLYNKNGPTWTSRDSGEEYYSASYVIDSTEERIATIKAALTDTKGTPCVASPANQLRPPTTASVAGTRFTNACANPSLMTRTYAACATVRE